MGRYDRQRRVGERGRETDDRLARLRVLLVGVGGIGSPLATGLVRAGVGELTIVDPDTVAESDLPRQTLFYPQDASEARLKVEGAERELVRIGGRSVVRVAPVALTPGNAPALVREADIVLDATDHLAARTWIDAACRREGRPWIHTAAIEDRWVVLPFLWVGPPCFRCYVPEPPPVEVAGTCESIGVLPIATALAANHALAILWSWLAGGLEEEPGLRPVLRGRISEPVPKITGLRADPSCPSCSSGMDLGERVASTGLRMLCGRRRVEGWLGLGAAELRERLVRPGDEWLVEETPGALLARRGAESITLAADGRLTYGPAEDLASARRRLREILGPSCSSASE